MNCEWLQEKSTTWSLQRWCSDSSAEAPVWWCNELYVNMSCLGGRSRVRSGYSSSLVWAPQSKYFRKKTVTMRIQWNENDYRWWWWVRMTMIIKNANRWQYLQRICLSCSETCQELYIEISPGFAIHSCWVLCCSWPKSPKGHLYTLGTPVGTWGKLKDCNCSFGGDPNVRKQSLSH